LGQLLGPVGGRRGANSDYVRPGFVLLKGLAPDGDGVLFGVVDPQASFSLMWEKTLVSRTTQLA